MPTTARELKFSEFIDLLLARLYDLEKDSGPGVMFDLNAVAKSLKVAAPSHWIFDAGKVLESRGWADVIFTFGGGCHARLTGEGRLYVEEEKGSGVIRRYHRKPKSFISVSGVGNQVIVRSRSGKIQNRTALERERAPALELVRDLRKALKRDRSLTEEQRDDLLTDIDLIEAQIKKREPNRVALAALLEPLSRVTSGTAVVADLIRLLNNP